MTKPLTPRQDRFCHAFVNCGNGAYAARAAGYAPESARFQGSRLLSTARIRARVGEIQAALARDHGRDRDALIGKLEVVYRRALDDHQFYTAARAVELQARLAGMTAGGSARSAAECQQMTTFDNVSAEILRLSPTPPLDIAAASGPLAPTGPGPEAAKVAAKDES